MESISTDCENIETYLTEYSRNQLSKIENQEVEKHLETCIKCTKSLGEIIDLSLKIDKLIPVVGRTYERDFIYRLFINSKPESIFIKGIAALLIGSLIIFMLSSLSQPNADYTNIGSLENRAKNIFNEDYYSRGQNK